MRLLVQRVSSARVEVDGQLVGASGAGFLVLAGFASDDTLEKVEFLADKCVNLRVFEDEAGKMNRSLLDTGGELLVVSQFTLYGDASRGRRPDFTAAARPETALPLYEALLAAFRRRGVRTASGKFGAEMRVTPVNEGPVTILLEK